MAQQFIISSVVSVILSGQATLTLTEGTDYSLTVSSASSVFARITSTRNTSVGRTSGGGNQLGDDVQSKLDDGDILNEIVLTRAGTATDSRVIVTIYEYTGDAGGDDEFIVRGRGELEMTSAVSASESLQVPNIVDIDDCVIFNTGSLNTGTSNTLVNSGLVTAEWVGGMAKVTRGTGWTSTSQTSLVGVEFTGSNWTINRQEFAHPTSSNTDTLTTLATSVDSSKTFLHYTYRCNSGDNGLDDSGVQCVLASDTQVQLRATTATNNATKKIVVWFIENSSENASVNEHFETTIGSGTGNEEQVIDHALSSSPDTELTAGNVSVEGMSADCTGAGTAHPRGNIAGHLINPGGGTVLRTYQSDNGQTSNVGAQIFIWPDSVDGATEKEFSATLAGTSTLTASGSAIREASATLAGSSSITVSVSAIREIGATLAGNSTATAQAIRRRSASASLAGASSLTSVAIRRRSTSATLSGSSTLSATAEKEGTEKTIAATLAGSSSLSAVVSARRFGSATLSGGSALSVATIRRRPIGAGLAGSSTLSCGVSAIRSVSVSLAGSSTLSASVTGFSVTLQRVLATSETIDEIGALSLAIDTIEATDSDDSRVLSTSQTIDRIRAIDEPDHSQQITATCDTID